MAKLVTKWRYLKPDAARHAQAYIRYIATREGGEKYVEENGARPAAQAQRVLVEKLLRDFPDARRSFEYEDYARRPTVRNASEFITRTLEEHLELFDARSNYVSYIAQRPRVQRSGAHGLFTQEEDAPDLNAAARAVSEHDGNIWTCILSLRREDAARLSYDKADAWRALLRANAAEIAARFNVPVGSFHWCGAFHNEAHHPHVHLVCYADRVQKPALTKEGVVQLRSLLARQIFRDELDAIYIRQSQSRDELRDLFSARLKEAVAGMRDAPAEMPVLESLLERLSEEVRDRKGRLQYGYLPWPVKSIVDSIISELEKQPQVKAAYSAWWELRKTVLSTYRDSLPEQAPPLHTQKEFRHLKNIVLRIAKEGCPAPEPEQEFDAVQDPQDRGAQHAVYGAQHAVYGAKRLLDAAREEEYPDEDVQAALSCTGRDTFCRGMTPAQKCFLKGPQSMKIILRNTRSESCTRMRRRRSSTKRKPRTGLNGLRSMGTGSPNTGLRNVTLREKAVLWMQNPRHGFLPKRRRRLTYLCADSRRPGQNTSWESCTSGEMAFSGIGRKRRSCCEARHRTEMNSHSVCCSGVRSGTGSAQWTLRWV